MDTETDHVEDDRVVVTATEEHFEVASSMLQLLTQTFQGPADALLVALIVVHELLGAASQPEAVEVNTERFITYLRQMNTSAGTPTSELH